MSALPLKRIAEPEDRLVRLSLDSVRPSPENNLIYRPVLASGPEILELARSILKHGLQEPLVVTRDGYILSGHRRYAACRLAGIEDVPCRIKDISRNDPGFVPMLREFNRQRVKGFDEIVREQVVTQAPANAYQSLVEYRKAQAEVSGEFLTIGEKKARKGISGGKRPMLEVAIRIVNDRREHWPLSDRSIHYEVLNTPPLRHARKPDSQYVNDRASYQDLCDLLTRARLSGEIPFNAIADPTRTVTNWKTHREPSTFLKSEFDDFLKGYHRNLQQSQPCHIEIVGEKNTIEGSIKSVASEYRVPYTLGRGYCSLDPRYKMYKRFRDSGKSRLIVLVMSDFDPEGEDIAHSFARSMRDDFGVASIVAKKVCLTHEQVLERDLPQTFDIKKNSSRYKKFAKKYGDRAHELEALPPEERSRLLTEAIDSVLDIDAYNAEVKAEQEDAARIAVMRAKAVAALATALESKTEGEL
jgi:hypothetical protein